VLVVLALVREYVYATPTTKSRECCQQYTNLSVLDLLRYTGSLSLLLSSSSKVEGRERVLKVKEG
jgi:hypothetical protein